MKKCRCCGCLTKKRRCPYCNCKYLIDETFDRCNEKKEINWEAIRYDNSSRTHRLFAKGET